MAEDKIRKDNKILVIRYGTIGDTVFASAFYRELRKNYPKATIDILVDNISYQIMKNCPYINNHFKINGKYKNLFYYIKLFKNYDTVYFLKNDSFFTQVAFIARIPNRIGFNLRRNFMLTKKTDYISTQHEIDCYLSLLPNYESNSTEVWVSDIAKENIKPILSNIDKPIVIIQALSRFSLKNWDNEKWREIVKFLSNDLKYQVIYMGSDKDDYSIINSCPNECEIKPINLCGKLSLQESMAIIQNANLFIGIDSGLMHVAATFNIPSILLNGPTSVVHWQPQNDNCTVLTKQYSCSPCILQPNTKCHCKNKAKCMEAISTDEVKEAIQKRIIKY